MSRIPTVTFTADYFRKTVRNESSYPLVWRVAKEVIQNSRDAGATSLSIYANGTDKTLEFIDDAGGMDEDTLLDVFLALGGSKKDSDIDGGSIGGFGDAKKVIFLCWDKWEIHTQNNYLTNDMLGVKPVIKDDVRLDGTRIKIWLKSEYNFDELIKYIQLCQIDTMDIKIYEINDVTGIYDVTEPEKLYRRKLTRDLGWGKVYINKSKPTQQLIVRLNGLALFTRSLHGIKATAILELENMCDPKSSDYMLNVTRESLKWKYQRQLDELIRKMTSDPRKALKEETKDVVEVFKGSKGKAKTIKQFMDIGEKKNILTMKEFLERARQYYPDVIGRALEESNMQLTELMKSDVEFISDSAPVTIFEHIMNSMSMLEIFELASSKNIDMFNNVLPAMGITDIEIETKESDGENELTKVYPYDFVIIGGGNKSYDSLKYQKILLAWHKAIEYICYYNNLNDSYIDLGEYTIGFVFDDDCKARYMRTEGEKYILLNPSDLNFTDYSWRGLTMEILTRACHEVAHDRYIEHDGNFIAHEAAIRNICFWYIDDFFTVVGGIIRSTKDEILENSMLDEQYEFEI